MRDVLIALAPALLGSIYFFGFRSLMVTLVSAAACVFFEWLYCQILKKPCKTYDLSACVTGVLQYSNHFELLVAVMLSAQCTDKRINMVTPALFAAYPTAEAMARATFDEVFALVKSVSYPNSKTRHLIEMAQAGFL